MRTLYLNSRPLEVLAGSVTDEVNAAGSAEFTVPARLEPMAAGQRVRLEDGNETVWVGRVLRCSEDMDGFYTVSCEGALAYFNDSVMEPYNISGTASAIIAAAVNAHNSQVEEWKRVSVGVVTVDFGTDSKESIEHCETMHYLSECLDRWGGYMHLRPEGSTLYLDWLAEGNGDAGAAVIGENISDYTDERDGEGIITRYKPLGQLADDGTQLDITSLPDGTADGYTKAGAWVQRDDLVAAYGLISRTLDSDAETAADLLAYAKAELAKVGASRVTQVEIVPGPNVLPGRRMRAMLPSGQAKAIVTSRTWVLEDESQDSAIIGTATATLSEATAARSLPPAVRVSNGSQAISGDLVVGGNAYIAGDITFSGGSLASMFSATRVSKTIGSIAGSSTKTLTISAARDGYRPIAISGWYVYGAATLHPYRLELSGTNVECYLRNNLTSATSSTAVLYVQVLYVKTGGSGDSSIPAYTGEYSVTPRVYEQTLDTDGKRMLDDVTVEVIPVARVSNESGGDTATIGE